MLMQMDCLVSPSELAKNGLFLSSRSEGECDALELYFMLIYVSMGMCVVYLLCLCILTSWLAHVHTFL